MKFAAVAAFAGVATASQAAWGKYPPAMNGTAPSYVTEVLTAYTTYCPGPTSIVHGGTTYTVTSATTLTITNCPCTVTYPATPSVYTSCSTCMPTPSPAPPAPVPTGGAVPPPPAANGTAPAPTAPSAGPVKPTPSAFTGAANKAVAGAGAGLAAIVGLAALL